MSVRLGAVGMTLAGVLLAQAPPPATKAEGLAELYGRTLGAAAECADIARLRIADAAEKASARLKILAPEPAESASAGTALAAAIARGGRDVTSGAVTCVQAESELANLERELAPP